MKYYHVYEMYNVYEIMKCKGDLRTSYTAHHLNQSQACIFIILNQSIILI